MFGSQASRAIGDYAQTQRNKADELRTAANRETNLTRREELNQQALQIESNWGDQGVLRPDGSVVVFEVDQSLHNEIMQAAIPQRPVPGIPSNPNAPKITDPSTPGTSLELPAVWNSLLEKHSSKARVLSNDEFLKEFGK